ncbi:YfcE family phosphodiesterase [Methanothermococcus sp. SCGC AD-155-E23]|nr:YfcE family phosphodiesterase [Methanothermococcus sp. SCGC AD-155-E23]
MILGVISDTHVYDRADKVPEEVFQHFSDVDLIIHCGDITSEYVLRDLSDLSKTVAVRGNMDYLDLPREVILDIEGFKVGVIHGDIIYPRGDILKMKYYCLEKNLDVLISGHTHVPLIKEIYVEELNKKILLLNPGSPTVPRGFGRSIMKVEIKDNYIKPILIPL